MATFSPDKNHEFFVDPLPSQQANGFTTNELFNQDTYNSINSNGSQPLFDLVQIADVYKANLTLLQHSTQVLDEYNDAMNEAYTDQSLLIELTDDQDYVSCRDHNRPQKVSYLVDNYPETNGTTV